MALLLLLSLLLLLPMDMFRVP